MSNCIQKDFVIQSQNVLQFSTQIRQKLLGTFQGFLYVHTYKQIPLLNKTLVPYHKDEFVHFFPESSFNERDLNYFQSF